MTESCGENSVFSVSSTVSQIGAKFPGAVEVYTRGAMHFARKRGVYVLNTGDSRQVRIIGQCPNFQNGSCVLRANCFSGQSDGSH